MEHVAVDGCSATHGGVYCQLSIMSFYIQGDIVGLLQYSLLRECVGEHDGGTMGGAAVSPKGITRVRRGFAQLAAQARHSQAFIILQREGFHTHLPFNCWGGVSNSLLHEDFFKLHLRSTYGWSCGSLPQLPRLLRPWVYLVGTRL